MNAKQKKARLAILKDTLAVITKVKAIEVKQDEGYLNFWTSAKDIDFNVFGYSQTETWIRENANLPFHTDLLRDAKVTKCQVCAKGAMFLAKVDKHNKVSIVDADSADDDFMCDYLGDEFDQDELDTIEYVFENCCPDEAPKLQSACRGKKDKARLVAMLQFLIKNDSVVE